jgi:dTMP kinase
LSGTLIVFEGIDGAGKSTQIRLLADALRRAGVEPLVSREPTDGPWGRKLRESAASGRMSAEAELSAFIHDRTAHVENLIHPSLEAGRTVILDRYYYSTIAYQGARGIDTAGLRARMEEMFPRPDRVFLLDLDPRAAVQRIAECRGEQPNEFEQLEALARIREIFLSLKDDRMVVLDAGRPAEEVHEAVMRSLP